MNATWLPYLFGFLTLLGIALLIKSVAKLIAVYTTGPRIEWAAQLPLSDFNLTKTGTYEISVKRSSIFGLIPNNNVFRLSNRQNGQSIAIDSYSFLLSKRTDMSGNRIVPVADFTITQPGSYRLQVPSNTRFTEQDKLIVTPKVGAEGILMILGTVFSSVLSIASLVLFTLSLITK